MDLTRKQALKGIPAYDESTNPSNGWADPRAEDEGRRALEAAIRCTLFVHDQLLPEEGDNHEAIAEAVIWAIDEAGWDDQEALQSAAMSRFDDQYAHGDGEGF